MLPHHFLDSIPVAPHSFHPQRPARASVFSMDPVSGLALACNIIDLVGNAVKGGAAVLQVYKSVNGLSNANETITRAADSLRDIVTDLQECQSQAPENTANQKMRQISATLISQCIELQSVLDGCRSSKKWGVFSASKASAKSLRMSGKIQQLQDEIVASRDELFRWIAASTRLVTPYYYVLVRHHDPDLEVEY